MDTSQLQFIASVSSSVAVLSYRGWQLFRKRYAQKNYGILVSSVDGIKELLDEINIDTQRIKPIVMEDAVAAFLDDKEREQLARFRLNDPTLYETFFARHAKTYLKALRKTEKRVVFVLITSSNYLLENLKMKPASISTMLPTTRYHVRICNDVEEEKDRVLLSVNREKYFSLPYTRFEFDNRNELVNFLRHIFAPRNVVTMV